MVPGVPAPGWTRVSGGPDGAASAVLADLDALVSPDAKTVVFTPHGDNYGDGTTDYYIVDVATGRQTAHLTGPVMSSLTWSRDGKVLAGETLASVNCGSYNCTRLDSHIGILDVTTATVATYKVAAKDDTNRIRGVWGVSNPRSDGGRRVGFDRRDTDTPGEPRRPPRMSPVANSRRTKPAPSPGGAETAGSRVPVFSHTAAVGQWVVGGGTFRACLAPYVRACNAMEVAVPRAFRRSSQGDTSGIRMALLGMRRVGI